jgi:predicted metal-dependent phosphoesterase TrpH
LTTPEELVYYAKKSGLDGVAVTDHNRLDSAQKIAKETNFLIIPGMEIESLGGHIVGLNVNKPVPKKLSVDETVDRIHEADGLAIACHPITFFKGSLGKNTNSKFDAVEVINASAFPFRYSMKHSQMLADRLGKPCVGGSDAHYGPEIGCAYTLVNAEPNTESIIKAIKNGSCRPFGKSIPWRIRIKRELVTFKRNL